jgi:segregation and condensation protein A
MTYVVQLEAFEGPLDLLLHLIQREEMDVYDIPIARITAQYLRQIENLDALDLHAAGDYLVMAATLLRIKARLLLPIQRPGEEAADDPRRELVDRLLEYKKFKEAARTLAGHEDERARRFAHPVDPAWIESLKSNPDEVTFEIGMGPLLKALQEVLGRIDEVVTHEVQLEPVALEERVAHLRERLRARGRLAWSELFEGAHTRLDVIVTFMAMLELAKGGALQVHQAQNFGELWIFTRGTATETAAPLEEAR